MNDAQLLRYSRHLLLTDLGVEGQQRLLGAHALVIGAGGLGSPVALYLASAGVGRITVVDADTVDATNLQRQIAHSMDTVGLPKVHSAAASMARLNPDVQVHCIEARADAELLAHWVPQAQVVLDCTDNYATRHAINRSCIAAGVPLVSGSALGFDGQVSVFGMPHGPCYACVFPEAGAGQVEEARCATMGVFAPLVGIIGTVQAAEALKVLTGVGTTLAGRLQMLDARRMEWTELRVARAPRCAVCDSPNTP